MICLHTCIFYSDQFGRNFVEMLRFLDQFINYLSHASLFWVPEYVSYLNIGYLYIILLQCTYYTDYNAIDTYPDQWWECLTCMYIKKQEYIIQKELCEDRLYPRFVLLFVTMPDISRVLWAV